MRRLHCPLWRRSLVSIPSSNWMILIPQCVTTKAIRQMQPIALHFTKMDFGHLWLNNKEEDASP